MAAFGIIQVGSEQLENMVGFYHNVQRAGFRFM